MSATLEANQRDKLGSRWARRLRMQGRLPACVQGEGKGEPADSSTDDCYGHGITPSPPARRV